MRILVFDDEAAVGRLVARVATMVGLTASAVTDVAAFEAHVHHDAPDVIVLDLQLEDTDGVTQLRWLADQKYTGSLILVSGFDARVLATAKTVGQSLGLKIAEVLSKPLRLAELEALFIGLAPNARTLTNDQLVDAMATGELSLEFQPVVSRRPNELHKLEALIRWIHPTAGRVTPGSFLPMAERDTAVIDALTDWVTAAVVKSYHALQQAGLRVPLAINLSSRNLHDLNLPDRIEQRLRQGNMPPSDLCLEITESAAFSDATRSMDILSRMRLKGMKLSIDDFGTGYSSFKILRQMPFTEIKIDQSFVCDMATSRDSRAIVQSICDLARNMDLDCVAEGIETAEAADLLEQMGVRKLQGYYIARPMPVADIAPWVAAWKRLGTASAA